MQVSLNEYIELAKEYSGEKSYLFVNGILNEILRKMKRDGTLLKATTLKEETPIATEEESPRSEAEEKE